MVREGRDGGEEAAAEIDAGEGPCGCCHGVGNEEGEQRDRDASGPGSGSRSILKDQEPDTFWTLVFLSNECASLGGLTCVGWARCG